MVCLDFFESGLVKQRNVLPVQSLPGLNLQKSADGLQGQVLIIEDLTKDVIKFVGSSLSLDPAFFASHIYEARRDVDILKKYPEQLPSTKKRGGFLSLTCYQAMEFCSPDSSVPKGLMCKSNVRRKVNFSEALNPSSNQRIVGMVQRKITATKTLTEAGIWLGS
jgi:hypothetical protein